MLMTGEGLAELRRQYVDAVPAPQTNNEHEAIAYGMAVLLADSTAIVHYFQRTARAVGNDSHGDSHELEIK